MKTHPHVALAGSFFLLLVLSGCKQEIVQPLTTPEKVRKESKKGKPAETATPVPRKTPPPRRAARTPLPGSVRPAEVSPGASAAPEPGVDQVILAGQMTADCGTSDTEGGWTLDRNGMIHIMHYPVPVPLREVRIEMKGTKADGIWPEVDLTFYNRTRQEYYYPLPKSYVTWADYAEKIIPVSRLPEGEYQIALRFYNNEGPETKEDRKVSLRKITLVHVDLSTLH